MKCKQCGIEFGKKAWMAQVVTQKITTYSRILGYSEGEGFILDKNAIFSSEPEAIEIPSFECGYCGQIYFEDQAKEILRG